MSPDRTAKTRPLVLCADDYAQDASVSHAIVRLARQQRLSATSAMVLSPRWPEDAAVLADLRDELDVGLHLDWTSAFAVAAGHGMTLAAAMRQALLGKLQQSAARTVIERQLDLFEAHWHAAPDHIDGHQHVQQFAGIREALAQVLEQRYGARPPWLRISRLPPGQRDLKGRIIAWMGAQQLTTLALQARLPVAPWLSGVYNFQGDQAHYVQRMAGWLADSPPATVLMCHPGTGEGDSAAPHDAIAAARVHEWRHLASSAFAQQLASAGVALARGSRLYTSPP